MKIFNDKYNIILTVTAILFVITVSGVILFRSLKKNIISENLNKKTDHITLAENILFREYALNKQKLTASKRFIDYIFYNSADIVIDSSEMITITAQKKNESFNKIFKIPSIKINNQTINDFNSLVDNELYINNVFCEIWQKSNNEFVRITSGKPNNKNTFLFIEKTEEPARTVLQGSEYFENVKTETDLKFDLSFPIYYKGEIIFFVSLENNKNFLSSINLLLSGKKNNIVVINDNGMIIFENNNLRNIPDEINLRKNISVNSDNLKSKTFKDAVLYFRYIPELSIYAGVVQSNSELNLKIKQLKLIIFYIFLSLAVIFILIFLINKNKYKLNKKKLLNNFSSFLPEEVSNTKSTKTFAVYLKKYLSEINQFSGKLSSGNYESKINDKYVNDPIFLNLNHIQNTFLQEKQAESKQQEEIKNKEKYDKSAVQISEILQYATTIEDLSFKIIKHLSEFLGAEQMAFFLVDEDLQKVKTLRMTASYAYSKQRTTNKILNTNEGLTGRVYLEKKSVFLTEIPDNYTFIESGFGFQKPNCLLIVPLIFNNDVQALIELGSIKITEANDIRFLEDVGENIASTVANLKHSKQTEILLKQTTKQSQEIEDQRKTLEEKINTHRKQNRNLDKQILQLIEIIDSIKSVSFLIEYDLKGNIMDVSSKVINLFEADKDNFISKLHKDIIKSENYTQKYAAFWTDLIANKIQHIEETLYVGRKTVNMKQTYVPIKNVRRKIYRILSIGTIIE